jgi:hypothetical protein
MNAIPIDSYAQLIAVLRDRVSELNVVLDTVDRIGGLPERYASKLLAPWPGKGLGALSLFPVIQALGLRLRLEPDDALLAKLRKHAVDARGIGGVGA